VSLFTTVPWLLLPLTYAFHSFADYVFLFCIVFVFSAILSSDSLVGKWNVWHDAGRTNGRLAKVRVFRFRFFFFPACVYLLSEYLLAVFYFFVMCLPVELIENTMFFRVSFTRALTTLKARSHLYAVVGVGDLEVVLLVRFLFHFDLFRFGEQ
jgi:hypothetical protein